MLDAVGQDAGSGRRLRPPVFEKEWPAFSRAIRDWRAPTLQRTIARLYDAGRGLSRANFMKDQVAKHPWGSQ